PVFLHADARVHESSLDTLDTSQQYRHASVLEFTYQRRLRCLGAPISIDYTRVADDLGQPALCHFFQLEYRRIAFRIAASRRRCLDRQISSVEAQGRIGWDLSTRRERRTIAAIATGSHWTE